jgi:hypothetical protein
MDLYTGTITEIDGTYFGLSLHGRTYPLSETFDKLYLDAGLGFNSLTVSDYKPAEFSGLTLGLKIGWKVLFTERFFMEPSLEYLLSKTSGFTFTPHEWQTGLTLGIAF